MKKSILFVAALFCGAMAFAQEEPEVINTWVNDELAVEKEWVNETAYPTFEFDEYISAGCTGTDNGVFYATAKSTGDWRVYEARGDKNGKFWIAAKDAKITKLSFTFYGAGMAKGGGVIAFKPGDLQTDTLTSDSMLVFEQGVDSVILYAVSSPNAAEAKIGAAQVRIQRFYVEYVITPTALKETAVEQKATKVVRNGQLYIRKGEKEFNVLGF